jgi:hypothetical protein
MFFCIMKSGGRAYVQVVENKRVGEAMRNPSLSIWGAASTSSHSALSLRCSPPAAPRFIQDTIE